LKKFLFFTVLALTLTVFLANSFAGEANEYVKVEKNAMAKSAQRSFILADDGTILARLYLENREDIPLDQIPEYVQEAFIAIEDERFYEHKGVDYYGITRAAVTNVKNQKIVEGGSTITQQYVKNSVGERDRTFTRKIKEAVMALRLEQQHSKKEILEAYLNTIYFGHGAYGVEAAAEKFFGKKASELTVAEGALLAGVTKAPFDFSPYRNPDKAFRRQVIVIDQMARLGYITKEEAEQAKNTHPNLKPLEEEQIIAPYFVEHVKQDLIKKYGVEKVFKGGLRIHTTLNIRAQRFAEEAVARQLDRENDPQAALVSINPKNGHIIAMVGGRDFQNVKYNLATQGKRQPGSAFKMFVLVTALMQGVSPDDTFNSSSPQSIKISDNRYDKPWIVRNCEGGGHGMMKLRDATVKSVNAVYANVTMKVGAENIVKTAHAMGIKTKIDPYPSIGIGGLTIGVSPLEMASAYGTLANQGVHVEPMAVTKITDAGGHVIEEFQPVSNQAIDRNIANQATDILQGVIQRGTATRANIGRPAAGKTGTNQLYRDAWFVGYTPNLVTAVWMGHPEAQISMYSVHGSRGFGGIIPATIWNHYMKNTLRGTPIEYFAKPDWPDKHASSWSSRAKTYIKNRWDNFKNGNDENIEEVQEQVKHQPVPKKSPQPAPPKKNKSPWTNNKLNDDNNDAVANDPHGDNDDDDESGGDSSEQTSNPRPVKPDKPNNPGRW